MSQIPMGKVLFRNIIRHTDAHNKILEESEMWKLRDMEKHASGDQVVFRRRKPVDTYRGHMHCDRFLEETSASARDREDEQEARYLTRKLYEFEASDPNRWGHSGFKELYPEEFETDGEKEGSDGENLRLRKRKGKAGVAKEGHKRSKKSSHKKKKKKEKKKRKVEEEEQEEEVGPGRRCSSSERSDGERRRRRRKSGKSKHRRKRKERGRERREESCLGDSSSEEGGARREQRPRKRRRRAGLGGESRALDEPHRKKRKDWKAANEEKSEESSED